MRDVHLRRGTDRDADDIAHVHRLSRAWHYATAADPGDGREALWSRLLAQPARITHVAERAGRIVGFLSVIRTAEPAEGLELTALYVLPDHAGHRVGSRLHDLFEGERRADEEGVLEVWEGNARAIAFYAGRGWLPTDLRRPGPRSTDFRTYRLAARHPAG